MQREHSKSETSINSSGMSPSANENIQTPLGFSIKTNKLGCFLRKTASGPSEPLYLRWELRERVPPCFFSLLLPSSLTTTSWSKRDNFLFSRTPFSCTDSKGSEDTRFKQSPLAGISAELIACTDWVRLKLPLTGSEVITGISSFYKDTINKGTTVSMLFFIPLAKNLTEIKFQICIILILTALTFFFNSKILTSKWFLPILRPRHQTDCVIMKFKSCYVNLAISTLKKLK